MDYNNVLKSKADVEICFSKLIQGKTDEDIVRLVELVSRMSKVKINLVFG